MRILLVPIKTRVSELILRIKMSVGLEECPFCKGKGVKPFDDNGSDLIKCHYCKGKN